MVNKIMRFMQGRYGVDELSKFLLVASLVFMLLANITGNRLFSIVGLIGLVFTYFRVFSKNPSSRYRENQRYLKKKNTFSRKMTLWNNRWHQRKAYRFYKCPSCKQKIRVPRGKSKIRITCPNCKTQFVKKT